MSASPQTDRVTRGMAEVNGIRLAYRFWRDGGANRCPPALLLHGVLQSGEGMLNLAAHLARHGPVLVPDLRGRGESGRSVDGYDPATMADDVAALIEALQLPPVVVIGRLHGGVVGYHLAARRPDLTAGLILGDVSPEVGEERAARALAAIRSLPRRFASFDDALAYYQASLGLSEARARHDIPHDLVADGDGLVWRHDLDLIERIERASAPRSDWGVLASIRCPILLLRGQHGGVRREVAERLRAEVPHARVQTILGARHDVFLGPGAEQAFGATDLFVLCHAPAHPAQLPLAGTDLEPEPIAEPPTFGGATMVERVVRAINGRDDRAIADLVSPGVTIRQYGPDGLVRSGGIDAVRAAFDAIFAEAPEAVVSATETVDGGDRLACVLVLEGLDGRGAEHPPLFVPVFLRLEDGRIAELTTYATRRAGAPAK